MTTSRYDSWACHWKSCPHCRQELEAGRMLQGPAPGLERCHSGASTPDEQGAWGAAATLQRAGSLAARMGSHSACKKCNHTNQSDALFSAWCPGPCLQRPLGPTQQRSRNYVLEGRQILIPAAKSKATSRHCSRPTAGRLPPPASKQQGVAACNRS